MGVDNRRRSPRYGVAVEGVIRGEGGMERTVAIANLSVEGCRINASGRRFAAGTLLTIGVGPVHGISFDQSLHPAVLDHIRLFLSREPALIEERPAA